MGRIPEHFIHDLLSRIDIVELIGSRIELKRAGREYRGLSPFTNEKTPSFFVNPAKQMFFDFSSGRHGNAIGFLMEFDRLSFPEAVEELARIAGVEVPREGGGPSQPTEGLVDVLEAAARIYRKALRDSPEAVRYLAGRGVDGALASRFGIGFAPDAWDTLARQLRATDDAVAAGLLVRRDDGRVYDRFRNRIMFPIRDGRGRVIAFGGRALGNDPAKYLNSPESAVFHKGRVLYGLHECRQQLASVDFLLVVEGYMDVVSLHGHGICQAVAAMGTALGDDQLRLLFRTTRRIVLCFDGDDAGRRAAAKSVERVLPHLQGDREVRLLFLPEGQDPDSLVRSEGAEAFRERIDAAVPLGEWLVQDMARGLDLATVDGRAGLVERARKRLSALPPTSALRGILHRQVGEMARVDGALLARPDRPGDAPSAPPPPGGRRMFRPVRRALQLVLEHPQLAEQVGDDPALLDVPGVPLLFEVCNFLVEHPQHGVALLLEQFRDRPAESRLLGTLAAGDEAGLDAQQAEAELREILARLRDRARRARVRELLARGADLSPAELRELDELTRRRAGPT